MAKQKIPSTTGKKKRGRPSKKNTADMGGEKRRGRPPKQKPDDMEMVRMTFILREDQRRWLRRQSFEAQDRGESDVDMSGIVRNLLDKAMKQKVK